MLVIRFSRRGKKHQPSYRIVVAEKRSKLTGECLEDLGSYSNLTKKATFNKERISYWISKGAQLSASLHNLLVKEKIIEGKKIAIKMPAIKAEASAKA